MNTFILFAMRYVYVLILVFGFGVAIVRAESLTNTSMRVEIINSYSGVLQLVSTGLSGNRLYDGSMYRTNQTGAYIALGANDTSNYVLSGDFVGGLDMGSGTGIYHSSYPISLLYTGGVNNLSIIYTKGSEPFIPQPLRIRVDQQAPSQPTPITQDNEILSGNVTLDRLSSIDTGIGLSSYTVLVGLTPSATSMIAIITSGTSIVIPENELPNGTIYRTVIATDRLGNQSTHVVGYFHHNFPTKVGQGGYQGGYSSPVDQVRNYYTPSLTDQQAQVFNMPIYIAESVKDTTTIHRVAQVLCTGLRIDALHHCYEWDELQQHIALDQDIVNSSGDRFVDILAQEYANSTDGYNNFIANTSPNLTFVSMGAAMYERYSVAPVGGRVLPKTGVDRSMLQDQPTPNRHDYELIIQQYGENIVPRTIQFSRYIVLIGMVIVGSAGWFFCGGYRHPYIITYRK